MKKLLIFIVVLLCIDTVFGQTIERDAFSSSGITIGNGNLLLNWSIGEVYTETMTGGDYILSQGFCQGKYTIVGMEDLAPLNHTIKVYPNPSSEYVSIRVVSGTPQSSTYHIQIIDPQGRIMYEEFNIKEKQRIPLSFLHAGYYIMCIRQGTQSNNYKIIKNQ